MVEYKEIAAFSKFRRRSKAKIIKYIEHCFGKDSSLNNVENFRERQLKAAKKAGMDITGEETLAIIDFRDPEVNILINTFLGQVQNSNLYDSLISNQYLFWSIQEEMRKPIDGKGIKDMTELSKHSEVIEQRISVLTKKIYAHTEVVEMGAKVIRMSYGQRVKERNNVS